eukprot:CAMPEP_0202710562 /NCGR_PEP_ID=MMETSP1385-20130828/22520_1 /ASSEMBLY_ACC=CAM_ASM_000861 /TAXON_ID=933848 /ORGANISM="Elphidium margaritaceum" /LENGTH=1596 /DNA_ID=CAMNT_0049370129 /DNA_START=389 /DNA_END=5179 /DNA_ORIENTATION=-
MQYTGQSYHPGFAANPQFAAQYGQQAAGYPPDASNPGAPAAAQYGMPAGYPPAAAQQFMPQSAAGMPAMNHYMYNPNNIANEANILKEKLQRRLAKDIEDFQAQLAQFKNFNAMPLKDKLEEWHFNVWPATGIYRDCCINGVIQFPTEYPQKPPTVELSVPIPHPNVKSISSKAWVNLDILSSNKWKQSYSILDIFRELSSVFESTQFNDLTDATPDDVSKAQLKLKSFKCMWTGHTAQNPVPKLGQPIPHSRKQIDQLRASQPLEIKNLGYQWQYTRIKQIECSFGKVYFEARVLGSVLGPNNLTTIQIGWCLPPDDDPALGEEFEYVVLGNRYYVERIAGLVIHKRPFEISHNNELQTGFGQVNDRIACTADFERKEISFWINGNVCGVIRFPISFVENDKPLVPVIGLSCASVELNFKQLQCPIAELTQNYLTVQEYLQIDRSDWVWERGSLVEWQFLFTYGLPLQHQPDATNGNGGGKYAKELRSAAHRRTHERFMKSLNETLRQFVLGIFRCLGFETLSRCREVCKIWNEVVNRAYLVHRSKLKCYYSEKSFDAKKTEIGLMLNLKIAPMTPSSTSTATTSGGKKNGAAPHMKVEVVSSSNDCISWSVWDKLHIHIDSKHEEFTHFLPIVVNEAHGRRVRGTLTKQIADILHKSGFRAEYALSLLASMLNSVVKSLHRELFVKRSSKQGNLSQIVSEKLTLWCHLHHMLLQLCAMYPAIQTAADSQLEQLVKNSGQQQQQQSSRMAQIPELGILIMYLLISENYTWHSIRRVLVEEQFCRDCRKLCEDGGDKGQAMKERLDNFELPDKERLDLMFKITKDSRSLTRLLIAFITLPHEYQNANNAKQLQKEQQPKRPSLDKQLELYNERFGAPHSNWVAEIEDKAEEISGAKEWKHFFEGIFVMAPPNKVISQLLWRCFIQGAQNGYYHIKSKLPKTSPAVTTTTTKTATSSAMNGRNNRSDRPAFDRREMNEFDRSDRGDRRERGGGGGPSGRGRGRGVIGRSDRGDRGGDRNERSDRMGMGMGMSSSRGGSMRGRGDRSERGRGGGDRSERGRGSFGDRSERGRGGRGRGRGDRDRDRDGGRQFMREREVVQPVQSERFKGLKSDRSERSTSDRYSSFDNYRGGGRGGRGDYRGGGGGDRGGGGRMGMGMGDRNRRGGGGGGRGGDNWNDPHFDPKKKVSAFTAKTVKISALSTMKQFPDWIRSGCKSQVQELNALQQKIVPDLCVGHDSIVVSPAGSGKATAVLLASLYRLYSKKAPTHILLICADHIHVEQLRRRCLALGESVPDLNVIPQISRGINVRPHHLQQGRNVFICTPGKAINLCECGQSPQESGRNSLIDNLVSVTIFDSDTLLVDPLFNKLKSTFRYLPVTINVNFVSNSFCQEMKVNIMENKLLDFDADTCKKQLLHRDYDNLKFWFVFCPQRSVRVPMLKELCKLNPYSQGLIYCGGGNQARIVQDALKSGEPSFSSRILETENMTDINEVINAYNAGNVQYIIANDFSPIHMLSQIDPKLLKVVINFELRSSSTFLKRACVAKYESAHKKVHYISLIDEGQSAVYEQVEANCNVSLVELPPNVNEVLIDEADAKNDE